MSDESSGIRFTGPVCPIPLSDYPSVQLAQGGGGRLSQSLIEEMFAKTFDNPELDMLHDGAILALREGDLDHVGAEPVDEDEHIMLCRAAELGDLVGPRLLLIIWLRGAVA